ncbi:hypothetical protein [Haloarchaeobius amylolyticus]|uniref:hypothetical protein n=1 Tax=Haloarchaeobius amylolyticus TaxID=1198296 RepID=UPI002270D482|nr:hypothetical protein [Haloarchaeobius amylolyticus]
MPDEAEATADEHARERRVPGRADDPGSDRDTGDGRGIEGDDAHRESATETDSSAASSLGRLGRTIPMLIPAWLATYPVGWLLGQQATVPSPWVVRWALLLAFAYHGADPENDPNGVIQFSVVSAVVFLVAQELFAPAVPAVQGRPMYLAGPALTLAGTYLLAYLVGYRDGVGAFRRWATDLVAVVRDAVPDRDDS